MTQMTPLGTRVPPLPVRYRAYGKDRLFDQWITFEADFAWQVTEWAEQRSWRRFDMNGNVLVETFTPTARLRLEWLVNGEWQAYTAWEGPERRRQLTDWITRWSGVNTYRITEEAPSGE